VSWFFAWRYSDISSLTHSKMDSCSPSDGPSAFLQLPLELRKIVYSYFLPNVTIHPGKEERGPLQNDGKSGGGSLLQVNRQIHNELFNDWYRSTTFEIAIVSPNAVSKNRLEFLNQGVQCACRRPSKLSRLYISALPSSLAIGCPEHPKPSQFLPKRFLLENAPSKSST
jgi:hypothetical protein